MIIKGKLIADEIQNEIGASIAKLNLQKKRQPCLAVILVGNDPASHIYVNKKVESCQKHGILSIKKNFRDTISELELLEEIQSLNKNPTVDGILVQLPLPNHISTPLVTATISPSKDVDGFHPINVGKLLSGDEDGFIPCTPLGIQVLMQKYNIQTEGKHAVIVGRSNIVGKPMASLLMQNKPTGNATVTIVHRHSTNLKAITQLADILIVAIGKPKFITVDMVKEGVAIFDVGINKITDHLKPTGSRLVGDVDYENVKDKCSFITPVPGGVGPMTIAMLLANTFKSYQRTERVS